MSLEDCDFVVYYCGSRIETAGSFVGNFISPVTRDDDPVLICASILSRLQRIRSAFLFLLDFFTTRRLDAFDDSTLDWHTFKARLEALLFRNGSAIVRLEEIRLQRAPFDRVAVLDISNQERLDQYVFDNLVDDLYLFCEYEINS